MGSADLFVPSNFAYLGNAKEYKIQGARDKELFEDSSGQWFLGKSNESGHPNVLCNELIAATFAKHLSLPIPQFGLHTYRGTQFFLSEWIQGATPIGVHYSRSLPERISDWGNLVRMVAFDLLLCNSDRHRANMLVIDKGPNLQLILIDHDLCLMAKSSDPQFLETRGSQSCWRMPHEESCEILALRRPTMEDFKPHIKDIHKIDDTLIEEYLRTINEMILSSSMRDSVGEFLSRRRDKLEDCVQNLLDVRFNLLETENNQSPSIEK